MELKETIEMMTSPDYKERFRAEYYQTLIRYNKLREMLIKESCGALEFKPTCPLNTLRNQQQAMSQYLDILRKRAKYESIELENA